MESSHQGQALKEAKEAQENETRRDEPSRAASAINTLAMENIRSDALKGGTCEALHQETASIRRRDEVAGGSGNENQNEIRTIKEIGQMVFFVELNSEGCEDVIGDCPDRSKTLSHNAGLARGGCGLHLRWRSMAHDDSFTKRSRLMQAPLGNTKDEQGSIAMFATARNDEINPTWGKPFAMCDIKL
ncbi:uncharacterized protein CCOS01_05324 [Colletotrichum costaricense]|uniref:Uncharacterized protein n=1 Tax=Colletotrichum costaricense TaxID=1209916 RepID=A0AAI9Z0A0_9PEZI|nr:uncharacterized protein CCOS01_05324 [Colletotrichum costaricense]KAK1530221.1 hypothetical protein CCOS01_05324 [Colletotrichum costaricense]